MESGGIQKIMTLCQACLYSCGIEVHVEGGKIVKIEGLPEHPVNKGRLCPKGANIIPWIYSPDRLKFPLKRDHAEWKRISWDEALDTIVLKLKKIKEDAHDVLDPVAEVRLFLIGMVVEGLRGHLHQGGLEFLQVFQISAVRKPEAFLIGYVGQYSPCR